MERDEARRQTVDQRVQEAKDNGWVLSPEDVPEHIQLLRTVALPDETVIMFYKGFPRRIDLREDDTGEKHQTTFVATDHSFIFVSPGGRGLRRSRPPMAKRVPFDEVKSVTVDQRKEDLVISFEGGQARLNMSGLAPLTSYERASGIVHYFKPFLPLRLQQDWQIVGGTTAGPLSCGPPDIWSLALGGGDGPV